MTTASIFEQHLLPLFKRSKKKNENKIKNFAILPVALTCYTPRMDWVARGTATPKDRDEVNRREV